MKAYKVLEAAKNSCTTIQTRNHLEAITWAPKYAEPGCDCGEAGIFMGNWNEPDIYDPIRKERVPVEDSKVVSRLLRCLEKCGAEIEWSDEWTTCSDCGAALRTQPDSHCWQSAAVEMGDQVFCQECAEVEEDDSEEDDSEEDHALSDCVNWEDNPQGNCGGRMMEYRGEMICENCFNDPAVEASKLLSKKALLDSAKHGQELGTCDEDS